MLGDAGEHYALSRFTFAGRPAMKMPEGWKDYDLAIESGAGLLQVSVKTRSETDGWKTSKWFTFDDRQRCDWMVFVFLPATGGIEAWIMPFQVAASCASVPGERRKNAHVRDLSWAKLQKQPLLAYKDNWQLTP